MASNHFADNCDEKIQLGQLSEKSDASQMFCLWTSLMNVREGFLPNILVVTSFPKGGPHP